MSDITISYKGNTIAEVSASGTTTLETAGKYCEDDISIDYVQSNPLAGKFGIAILNGDSTYNYTQNGQTSSTNLCFILFPDKAFGDQNMLSDNFQYNANNTVAYSMRGRSANGGVEFRLPSTVEYSVAGFKAWFAANPTILIYPLATP